jgi:hypothetical protein
MSKAVNFLTKGKTKSKVGKATNQDKPQALGHSSNKRCVKPTPRKVLIKETTQVMNIESKKGMTKFAYLVEILGKPNRRWEENNFIDSSISRTNKRLLAAMPLYPASEGKNQEETRKIVSH